jgi:cytochrome b pre-mRNA-processing protein 3
MAHAGDIIPFPTRRRENAPAAPRGAVPATKGHALALVVALATLVGVSVVGVLLEGQSQREVSRLPITDRGAIFRRATDELATTCRLPEAADGPLRDHCTTEASFVLLFPECDAACGRTARDILPHARR